jgi:hypothetical protein
MKTSLKIFTGIAILIAISSGLIFFSTSGMKNTAGGIQSPENTSNPSSIHNESKKVPSKEDQISLTKKSIHDFLISVESKNMEHFRNSISQTWQNQISLEKLDQIFHPFYNLKTKFSNLESLEPILKDDTQIDEDGALVIKGYYPTEPQIGFEHKYIHEGATWKLFAFYFLNVNPFNPNAPKTIPSKEEQTFLTKKSMHDFTISVKNKNMEHFRNSISKVWQSQVTVEKLNEAFGALFNIEADLTLLDSVEPTLANDTLLDENGALVIKGYYATQPSQLLFEHTYIYEDTTWKLLKFHIQGK